MAKHKTLIAVEHDPEQSATVSVEPTGSEQWFRVFTTVVDSGAWGQLTGAAKGVLIVLARYVNDARRRATGEMVAYPSVRTIASAAGITVRGAQKALRELEAAKLIRRGAQRDEGTNEYRMLVTRPDRSRAAAKESAPHKCSAGGRTPVHPTPELPFAPTPNTRSSPPRSPVRRAGEPAFARNRRLQSDDLNSAPNDALFDALSSAGIKEPMCSRLIDQHEESELLLRIKDWKTRQKLGSKLGAAWLIASIQQGYDLHERTLREIETEKAAALAQAHRAEQAQLAAAREAEQVEIDRQVNELFDEMSDEELAHWKGVVVAEFPSLIRNPDRADPRTTDRLRRLILGKLAHLVAPAPDASRAN